MIRNFYLHILQCFYRHEKWVLFCNLRSGTIGVFALSTTLVWYVIPLLFIGYCLVGISAYIAPIAQLLAWYEATKPFPLNLPLHLSAFIVMYKWFTISFAKSMGSDDPTFAGLERVDKKLNQINDKLKALADD